MYECRHFFADDCERLPTSLEAVEELLVTAHDAYSNLLSVKFRSFEHVGPPPEIDDFLAKNDVKVATSRVTTSCPNEAHWSDG